MKNKQQNHQENDEKLSTIEVSELNWFSWWKVMDANAGQAKIGRSTEYNRMRIGISDSAQIIFHQQTPKLTWTMETRFTCVLSHIQIKKRKKRKIISNFGTLKLLKQTRHWHTDFHRCRLNRIMFSLRSFWHVYI